MRHILFLAHRAPWPPDRGDRIRSHHILRHLAARAHVHLIALDEDAAPPPADLAGSLASWTVVRRVKSRPRAMAEALATGRPLSLAAFAHTDVRAAVARCLATHPIAATYVFSGQMAQYLPDRGPLAVVDFVDVDSEKFAQMAAERGPSPMRTALRREARLLAAFEHRVAARASAALFVSDTEAELFRRCGGTGRIAVVENGVDTAIFDPAAVVAQPLASPTIVFTGQMDYQPNVDAAIRFARRVLPLVRRGRPDAAFAIVGRAPTPAVRALASADVTVTGAVADTRPWLAAAALCVAPLALARGVQNKVLEAMAMARPTLASPAAALGIDHAGTIAVADGDEAMAAAAVRLLGDVASAARMGPAARRRVEARYAWPAALAPLGDLLGLGAAA